MIGRRSWLMSVVGFVLSPLVLGKGGSGVRIPELFEMFDGKDAELIWEHAFLKDGRLLVYRSWRLKNKQQTKVMTVNGEVVMILLDEKEMDEVIREYRNEKMKRWIENWCKEGRDVDVENAKQSMRQVMKELAHDKRRYSDVS